MTPEELTNLREELKRKTQEATEKVAFLQSQGIPNVHDSKCEATDASGLGEGRQATREDHKA